jgi:hypothetical protein
MADQKLIRKTYEAIETKAVEVENRRLIVTISTSTSDRSKNITVLGRMRADNDPRIRGAAAIHHSYPLSIGRSVAFEHTDERADRDSYVLDSDAIVN